jgi:hypothetical protein
MRFNSIASHFRGTILAAFFVLACGSSLFARDAFMMPMIPGYPTSYKVPAGHRLVIEQINVTWGGPVDSSLFFSLSACNQGAPANQPGISLTEQCAAYEFTTGPVTNPSIPTTGSWPVRIYVEVGAGGADLACYFSTGALGTPNVPAGARINLTGYLEPSTDVDF